MEKIKTYFLGFFSNAYAQKATKGGFVPLAVNLILAIIVIFFGTVGAEYVSFYPRYGQADDFKATVNKLFTADGGNNITLFVDGDKYVTAGRGEGERKKAAIVDTFLSEEDRALYSVGGYNVVVDTRDAYAYADFEAYCESTDGDGITITYEEYRYLSEAAKKNFKFKIRYTPNEVDLSGEKTAERFEYLSAQGGDTAQAAGELKNKFASGETDEKEYAGNVWALYVKTYYPDLSEYEQNTGVPLIRNYYYHTYTLNGEKNYLFIFDDSVIGCFTTADGLAEEFYGFYENFPYGVVTDYENFIETAFSASFYLTQYVGFMNVMRFLPIYVLMPLVATIISYFIVKIGEKEKPKKFSDVLKITATFILWSAMIAAAATFALSLVIDRGLIFTAISVLYFIVITIRSIVWFSADIAKYKKDADAIGETGEKIDSLRG